jgi:hypothetical protein
VKISDLWFSQRRFLAAETVQYRDSDDEIQIVIEVEGDGLACFKRML